jgi:glycosyltransferase involved in cell wall biosynthesis
MDLSIVIPVFNEQRKIERDLAAASGFLARRRLSGEIIVSDDGSADGTADAAEEFGRAEGGPVVVLRNPHRGKGAAVRAGMTASTGAIALFLDSGLCVPYEDLDAGLAMIRSGECDIAHGSRRHAASRILRPQARSRRAASRAFRWAAAAFLGIPRNLTDTQVGCKIYRGAVARELYGACRTEGFAFDLEIILRAKAAGHAIGEFPIRWTSDPDSRLSFSRTPWGLIRDMWRLKGISKT